MKEILLALKVYLISMVFMASSQSSNAQVGKTTVWRQDGNAYYRMKNGGIIQVSLPDRTETVVAREENIQIDGKRITGVQSLAVSNNDQIILLFTNTKKVWSYRTRGDYWVYQMKDSSFSQLGKSLPASSLMFTKLSPDSRQAAYVSGNNLYVERLADHQIKQLTSDGNRKLINGTFDWVYEHEFDCRDGFRWSPDSKKIAYWQIDARNTKDYFMLNTTDSVYPYEVPVTTPVAGEPPSSCKIGVVDIITSQTKWMDIQTDTGLKSYIPRMEWTPDNAELIIQHLNRRQNESRLMLCNATTGAARTIYMEKDTAWINIQSYWDENYKMGGWDWLNQGQSFLWVSEKDGWRHIYKVSRDGKSESRLTPGPYDVMGIAAVDEKEGYVYFMASPDNATQAYLYRTRLDGKKKPDLLSPANQVGTHNYEISPNQKYAKHIFSNYYTFPIFEWITLADHKALDSMNSVNDLLQRKNKSKSNIEFFKIKTSGGVEMDAWKVMPGKFDSSKKYPVVFYVYSGPAAQTVLDYYGSTNNFVYSGDMARDGYIYVSVDNRGTPAPKGAAWRKSVYRKMGRLDISDQAAAAREVLKWQYVDSSRIAVWGWSNGGAAALNLLFQYPDIYKTGIAIAPITNYLYYDNIWQERIMGLPRDNKQDYLDGSPISYAKNLKGNLLFIHGSGDDNVHYKNAELLLNELISDNKVFQFMEYPNRSHDINEGSGTRRHLSNLYTTYLKEHCPPGPR